MEGTKMENTSDTAIVFFSKDGSTRLAAGILGRKTGGKIIELKEKKKGGVLKAIFKMGSKLIGEPWLAIKDVGKVYLMQPICASNGVPAMNTFLKNADFSGKKVSVITFQADTGFRGSSKIHQYIGGVVSGRGGTIASSYALLGAGMNECATENSINEQIEKIVLI